MRAQVVTLAVLVSACGRQGFELPGPIPPAEDRLVQITAPATSPAHAGCAVPLTLHVVDGTGLARAEARILSLAVSRGSLITPDSPGPMGQSLRVSTNPSGVAFATILPDEAIHPAATISIEARVEGYVNVAKRTVDFEPDLPPIVSAGIDHDGDGVADGGTFASLRVGTSARLVLTIADADEQVLPERVRWAWTDPLLGLGADADGTPGGDRLVGTVPLGVHAVVAEYPDCAGRIGSAYFRIEGGTRRRVHVEAAAIASNDVEQVEADRNSTMRAYIAFGVDQQAQRVTVGTAGGPTVVNLGNAARNIRRLEWARDAGSRLVATYEGQDGWQEIDGAAPSVVTTQANPPYDYEIERFAACDEGRGYATRNFAFTVEGYRWPTLSGDALLLDDLTGPIATRPRASGSCEIFGGTAGGAGVVVDTGGNLELATAWSETDGFFGDSTAVGFAGRPVLWAEDGGLWASDDSELPPRRLWDETGLAAGSVEVPAGFGFEQVVSITGGSFGGVEQAWIANATPAVGRESVLRLVRLTPRDAAGRASPPRWVPLAYFDDLLDDLSAVDVSVPRRFDGSLIAPQPVWVATPQGLVVLWWTP